MVAITQQTMADEIRRQQALSKSIAKDQAALSSQKKLQTASDDPQAWVQISELGRAQSQQAAWAANVSYGKTRATKAESNLDQINNLMSRARELSISASTGALDAAGKTAVVTELTSIKASIGELLNEKDYQGLPVFDDGTAVSVPISRGLNIDVVGTRQSIAGGIDVGTGTDMSIDDMFDAAITAVQTDSGDDQTAAVGYFDKGIQHVAQQQALQGVRADRLDSASDRLTDVSLTLAERRSDLEDTDLTATITRMQAKLLSLEAAQSALARINRQSLFDLIS